MKLEAGLFIEEEGTFGELRFSGLRKEQRVWDEEGQETSEVKGRSYYLISSAQRDLVPVILPGTIAVKDFPRGTVVELVNADVNAGANARFGGADVFWFVKADDIVLKKVTGSAPPPSAPQPPKQQGKANI